MPEYAALAAAAIGVLALGSLAVWLRWATALDRGAPVHLVAATLGPASIAIEAGRYAHARSSDSSSRDLTV